MNTGCWETWDETLEVKPLDSAIMKSLEYDSEKLPEFSPNLFTVKQNPLVNSCPKCHNNNKSFMLLDGLENLQISNPDEFLKKLTCTKNNTKVKVLSIFGNTCNGKSHTMNQVFFKGQEVFRASNEQNCCTLGVWAAFDPTLNVICLDTEGLEGVTSCENERAKLLLKVLAISDIVVYGIFSERLNRDLFMFLGTASHVYSQHFKAALQTIGQKEGISTSLSQFGPSIIVFHETKHTVPLINSTYHHSLRPTVISSQTENESESAEDILRTRFAQMSLGIDAFSSIKYIGLQTVNNVTDYQQLRIAIENELNNTTVRSARKPHLVYNALKNLQDQLTCETGKVSNTLFPEQYFTCPFKCLSCDTGCTNSMGHLREKQPHSSNVRCKYQCQYENLTYICRRCYKNGKEIEVTRRYYEENQNSWYSFAKNAWSGYVIDCSRCGEIYKSRQYWYGNNAEDVAIRKKITHVWNTSNSISSQNTAQWVVDGVSYITEAVTNVSLQPTKALKAWAADQVAPSYWRPNNEIKHCYQCKLLFSLTDDKHHCRDCGEGFCNQCSSKTKCVPYRNWFSPVRVCDACYERDTNCSSDDSLEPGIEDVGVRKVSEHVVSTFSAVGTVINYSKSIIKDTVRPSYWIPDAELINCCVCERKFSTMLPLHHCRACGRGVCQECSQHRKPVPRRGWDYPVRVCNACV
ncbi:zinc finger FYVE domain-containing protein 1 isoform X2 [Cardiocondyla obscurior]